MRQLAEKLEARRVELGLSKEALRRDLAMGTNQISMVFKGNWETLTWATIDRVRLRLGISDEDWLGMKTETQLLTGMDSKLNEILSIIRGEGEPQPQPVGPPGTGAGPEHFARRREALHTTEHLMTTLVEDDQKKVPEQHQGPPAKDSRRGTKKVGR